MPTEMRNVTFSSPVIVTGSNSTEDSALEWLKLFGAQTEDFNGCTFISLPENVKIEQGTYKSTFAVSFYSQLDDDETYVDVLLRPNARETEVTLQRDDKFKGIQEHAASVFNFKYKEGVLIKYISLEYTEEEYWEARFNIVSATEDRTIADVDMAFDFVDGKFTVVRPIIGEHPF
jgi:hypothetical protein